MVPSVIQEFVTVVADGKNMVLLKVRNCGLKELGQWIPILQT